MSRRHRSGSCTGLHAMTGTSLVPYAGSQRTPDRRVTVSRHLFGDGRRTPHHVAQRARGRSPRAAGGSPCRARWGDRLVEREVLVLHRAQRRVEVEPRVQAEPCAGGDGGEDVEQPEDVHGRRRDLEAVGVGEAERGDPVLHAVAHRTVGVADRLREPGRARAEHEHRVGVRDRRPARTRRDPTAPGDPRTASVGSVRQRVGERSPARRRRAPRVAVSRRRTRARPRRPSMPGCTRRPPRPAAVRRRPRTRTRAGSRTGTRCERRAARRRREQDQLPRLRARLHLAIRVAAVREVEHDAVTVALGAVVAAPRTASPWPGYGTKPTARGRPRGGSVTYRVIQWATGNIGERALAASHPPSRPRGRRPTRVRRRQDRCRRRRDRGHRAPSPACSPPTTSTRWSRSRPTACCTCPAGSTSTSSAGSSRRARTS